MKTLLLLVLITSLATIKLFAHTDFSDCDGIATKIANETNQAVRTQLTLQLLSCVNEKMQAAKLQMNPVITAMNSGPPMPPMPNPNAGVQPTHIPTRDKATFTVVCATCRQKYTGVPGTTVTNGQVAVINNGVTVGFKVQRTITFTCPSFKCQAVNNATDEKFQPAAIAIEEEEPQPKGGASIQSFVQPLVVTDTNPPVVSDFQVYQANITNFTNHVLFQWNIGDRGFWIDPVTGGTATKVLNVSWPVSNNWYYTAWHTTNLNSSWREFPLASSVHPARSNWTYALFFPILTNGMRFYMVRARSGNGVTYQ